MSHLKFHYLLSSDGASAIAIARDNDDLIVLSPLTEDKTRYEVLNCTKDIHDVVKEYSEGGYSPQGYVDLDVLLTEFGSELIIP
ncbi:hypothetical protein ABKU49_05275 [Enterobacter hormaechei]